jgi:hypothetical protein
MVLRPELKVSIDVGCHRHSVAVGLSTGELLEEFDIDHRPEGFAELFSRVERYQRRYPGPVSVAMEGCQRPCETARYAGERAPVALVQRQ